MSLISLSQNPCIKKSACFMQAKQKNKRSKMVIEEQTAEGNSIWSHLNQCNAIQYCTVD